MLCLTARDGEYFMIGDDIMVTFLKNKSSNQILVGISAPKSLSIRRDKIVEQEMELNGGKTPQEIFRAMEIVEELKRDKERIRDEMTRRADRIDRRRKAAVRRADENNVNPASAK